MVLGKYVVKRDRRYTDTDEWVVLDSNNVATIGITDYAQKKLRDIVGVELPDVNTNVKKGEAVASIESIKTVADVYAPLTGAIIEVNERLLEEPELLNLDPYGEGWLFKIKASSPEEYETLLSPERYADNITLREKQ